MFKLKLSSGLLFLLTVFALGNCNRDSSPQNDLSNTETTSKVIVWLEKKGSAALVGISRVLSLKENLDFSMLTTEHLRPDEPLIIIPVKNYFVTNIKLDKKAVNSLVLFVNKNKEIRKEFYDKLPVQ